MSVNESGTRVSFATATGLTTLDDYQRREQAQLMAAHPDWLAAVRAGQATLNTYLEERGLSPEPDPYHELP